MEENYNEEVMHLISKGYDLEVISIEFDISIEQLKEYKEQLENKKTEQVVPVKIKSSNIRKKEEKLAKLQENDEEVEIDQEEEIEKPNYEEVIETYKREIEKNPERLINKKNLLAFTYYRAGKINEARDELLDLIEEHSSHTAYRQLINLEKEEGNIEDAKLWAYDCLDKFPDSIAVREQLISIARQESDNSEIEKLLKEIININPVNSKAINRLNNLNRNEER